MGSSRSFVSQWAALSSKVNFLLTVEPMFVYLFMGGVSGIWLSSSLSP